MAFRDINPAPVNPLAYADLAAAPAQNFLAGQQQGMNAELVRRSVARDDATAAALSGYYEAPPDQRGAALNTLAGIDPAKAGQVMALQQEQRRAQAVDEYAKAQHVLSSENPALALRLLDSDGAFLKQLEDQGLINSADGISDDEARLVAQWAADTTGPIAGASSDGPRTSTDIATMQALGFPLTPEGFEKYNAAKGTGVGDPLTALLAQAQLDQRNEQLTRDRAAAATAAETAAKARQAAKDANAHIITQSGDIVQQAQDLEGTLLAVGVPGADIRRTISGLRAGAGALLGLDTSDADKLNGTYDKLVKNTSDQLINLMNSAPNMSNQSVQLLQQYQKALASPETALPAVLAIQANITEMALQQADREGFPVEDRKGVEERIRKLRGYSKPPGEPAVDVPAISRRIGEIANMTVDELTRLQSEAGTLSKEALEAAAQRWDELNAVPGQ